MELAHTDTLERIARVLAGLQLSWNGHGTAPSAGELVDRTWRDHLDDAGAILNALREPDARMVEVGDAATWNRMVRAALGENLSRLKGEGRSWAGDEDASRSALS